jgi:sucrose-phosphate synthase
MTDWCLVTDIDGTLIGDPAATELLRRSMLTAKKRLLDRGGSLRWAVATGRGIQSTQEVLREGGFDESDFDAFITSVGAELYFSTGSEPDPGYRSRLRESGFDAQLVRRVLDALPGLSPQPEHEQFEHKVCYFTTDEAQLRGRVRVALDGLPFSVTTVFAMGNYLDVAPANGAKGGAMAHLLDTWGLDVTRAVAAGDSGNDISMLERHWPAIVVGNGHDELACLRGRPGVYFATEGFAAGVLEGLRQLGFL